MIRAEVLVERPGQGWTRRRRSFRSWRAFSAWLWALKGGRWARFYESVPTGGSHLAEGRTPSGVRVVVLAREV